MHDQTPKPFYAIPSLPRVPSQTGYQHWRTTLRQTSAMSVVRRADTTSSRLVDGPISVSPYQHSSRNRSSAQLSVHQSISSKRISRLLYNPTRLFQPFYSMSVSTRLWPFCSCHSSAKQPLVRAPSAIKEPSLLRKLSAAGAQSTLSPVRKSAIPKENAIAGPSRPRPRMEPVGEASEEEDLSAMTRKKADSHRRELALQQKARILVDEKDRGSTPEPSAAPQREPMARAKTVVSREARERDHVDIKPTVPRETKAAKPRTGLLELVCRNLSFATEMAQTPRGFQSSCECLVYTQMTTAS
jgi:hypothetical protein